MPVQNYIAREVCAVDTVIMFSNTPYIRIYTPYGVSLDVGPEGPIRSKNKAIRYLNGKF